jgi:hypothetical protein
LPGAYPIVAALDHSVREQHPGYSISVTGLSAIAAHNSAAMIENLNRSGDRRGGVYRSCLSLVSGDVREHWL